MAQWRHLIGVVPQLLTRTLHDGTTAYHVRMPRGDDCFAAAAATCLQVPIGDVPDPQLAARQRGGEDPRVINRDAWDAWDRWLDARQLRLIRHRVVPARRRRWIGVVVDTGRWFSSHCLVMSDDSVLFDPALVGECTNPVFGPRLFGVDDITYGISFQRKERTPCQALDLVSPPATPRRTWVPPPVAPPVTLISR